MFNFQKILVWLGALLIIVATLCPLIENNQNQQFNLYQLDLRIFLIIYAFLALTLFSYFNQQIKKFMFLSLAFSIWTILLATLIYLKTTLNWTLHLAERLIQGQSVIFLWGWILLFTGALLLLIGAYLRTDKAL